jgi:hypothetical protein
MIYVDFDGWHEVCLQCGYNVELKNINIADCITTAGGSSIDPEKSANKTAHSEYTREG